MVCNGAAVRACYSDRTYVLGLLKGEEKTDERYWGGNGVRRCEETRHLLQLGGVLSLRCELRTPPRPTTVVGTSLLLLFSRSLFLWFADHADHETIISFY